uniref:Phosphatidate cytidylyltransferase n=1 Tax=Haemonchus placei TaxID=6290 RepID=A0A0N4W2V6_HAEPC
LWAITGEFYHSRSSRIIYFINRFMGSWIIFRQTSSMVRGFRQNRNYE